MNIIDKVNPIDKPYVTDAPSSVDVFFHKVSENQYLIQLINLSGFNGVTFTKPIELDDIHIELLNIHPEKFEALTAEGLKEIPLDGDRLKLKCSGCYAGYLVTCG